MCFRLYVPYFSDAFSKHLGKLTRRNRVLKDRTLAKVEEMMNDPYRNSEELTGKFKGKRRAYVGRAGYRLIYSICEECRMKGYEIFNSCFDCQSKKDNSIIFFDILHRSKGYRRF